MSNASSLVKQFLGESELWRDYKPEVRTLLKCLSDAGIQIRKASNGGEPNEDFTPAIPDFVEELTATEEAYLYVTTPSGKRATIYLVLGNSPGELVCDYTALPELEAPLNCASEAWWGKEQPMEAPPGATPDERAEKTHFDREASAPAFVPDPEGDDDESRAHPIEDPGEPEEEEDTGRGGNEKEQFYSDMGH